jgi:hypothetical protein
VKIKDVLYRDPSKQPLVNNGQARITSDADAKTLEELRGELSTFVCEGQYADGMVRILESFLKNQEKTNQPAAWVSGFFGSGKSHLLKMLCHLWQDTKFPDGATSRSLPDSLPSDVKDLLKELDTAGKRMGGLFAAAGALPSGTTDNVRLTVLGVILRGAGLPDQLPLAQFCLWLRDEGYYDKVKKAVEKAGKEWLAELSNLYVSGPIAKAVLACDPDFAPSETEARKTLRAQFPPTATDIPTPEFVALAKRALTLVGKDGKLPCTILVLDEVQQYIGSSNGRSTMVTEVAEAISKQLDSKIIVVGAGQNALTDVPLLQRLMDRFTIRVPLSDADVETVTRKVLLAKKPAVVEKVRAELREYTGEVSRQLQGTKLGERPEDRDILVEDYPLLPVRRRFWEECFRAIDAAGTKSQLRSQLRIIHDAVAAIADREVGCVVPADALYEALAPEMVATGVLLREINERIINLAKEGAGGQLASRICGLVFLIGKLPREGGADVGVRATKEMIADLLVDDLREDSGKLREKVGAALNKLASNGVLMVIGDEYRLQTREGAEWDKEFRNHQTKLMNDDPAVSTLRDHLLRAETEAIVRKVKLVQGSSKQPRHVDLHFGEAEPPAPGEDIPLWTRDGWNCSEKDVADSARKAGTNSPTVFVFTPRQSAEDLRRLIVDAAAAQQTLALKGQPGGPEGQVARDSMKSRQEVAESQRDQLVIQILANAKVFQGGGTELFQLNLAPKVEAGATASLARLFPRFKDADHGSWETALKRARDGAESPLGVVGWSGPTEQHPVCVEVLQVVGAGKAGNDVRKALGASPFGWPKDAVDTALIALHRSKHLRAMLNAAPVKSGQLDQNKIQKTDFRVESFTVTVPQRLKIRGLFQKVLASQKGEEEALAGPFLDTMTQLARDAGGPPPLPAAPAAVGIEELEGMAGTEQLLAIWSKAEALQTSADEWRKLGELARKRRPGWEALERLTRHADGLDRARDDLAQAAAIRDGRQLLDKTDRVAPVKASLAAALRSAVKEAHEEHEAAHRAALEQLDASDTWKRLSDTDRTEILKQVDLKPVPALSVAAEDDLLAALDATPLSARRAAADAVAGRVSRALLLAAKRLEPEARPHAIDRATLHNEVEVREWLGREEKALLDAVKRGPIVIT